jgi:hypothetical protein
MILEMGRSFHWGIRSLILVGVKKFTSAEKMPVNVLVL